jgi:hypothetical protein
LAARYRLDDVNHMMRCKICNGGMVINCREAAGPAGPVCG